MFAGEISKIDTSCSSGTRMGYMYVPQLLTEQESVCVHII